MAAGGAVSDNLESRLTKDASSVDGKCLPSLNQYQSLQRQDRQTWSSGIFQ
jgi:hypothetical protein